MSQGTGRIKLFGWIDVPQAEDLITKCRVTATVWHCKVWLNVGHTSVISENINKENWVFSRYLLHNPIVKHPRTVIEQVRGNLRSVSWGISLKCGAYFLLWPVYGMWSVSNWKQWGEEVARAVGGQLVTQVLPVQFYGLADWILVGSSASLITTVEKASAFTSSCQS